MSQSPERLRFIWGYRATARRSMSSDLASSPPSSTRDKAWTYLPCPACPPRTLSSAALAGIERGEVASAPSVEELHKLSPNLPAGAALNVALDRRPVSRVDSRPEGARVDDVAISGWLSPPWQADRAVGS
jgi:hypothetical protein